MGNLALVGDVKMIMQYRIGKTKWDQTALYTGRYTVRALGQQGVLFWVKY